MYSYFIHSIILGLIAAIFGLQIGVAARALTAEKRSTSVTCGGQFPKAGDGFAQRPDGCSSVTDNPDQVRDSWGKANFGGVCNDHDRCYYTIGANVDECNSNFCNGLEKACHKAYCLPIVGAACGLLDTYTACATIAGVYCATVKSVAAEVYEKAQTLQKSYDTCIAEHGGIAPPTTCEGGVPDLATWTETIPGVHCQLIRYNCYRGQIDTTIIHVSECTEH
jgi:hypothetical protein